MRQMEEKKVHLAPPSATKPIAEKQRGSCERYLNVDEFRFCGYAVVAPGTVDQLGAPRHPSLGLGGRNVLALAGSDGQLGETLSLFLVVLELLLWHPNKRLSHFHHRHRGTNATTATLVT